MIEWIPRVLAVVSTLFTMFLLYVVMFHTPSSMRGYKKVIILMMFSVYQFDVSYGFLLLFVPLPGAFGCQLTGFLGELFPSLSNYFVLLCVLSVSLGTYTSVVGFVYREYTVARDKARTKKVLILELLISALLGLAHLVLQCFAQTDYSITLEYLRNNNISFDYELGVFIIAPEKVPFMKMTAIAGLSFVAALSICICKSVYTVNTLLNGKSEQLSVQTIRLQKMLLRALIWQALAPLVLLAVPSIFLGLVTLCDPSEKYAELGVLLTEIVFSTPCFYSPAHDMCVIIFTTPYKKYVLNKIQKRKRTTITITAPASKESYFK